MPSTIIDVRMAYTEAEEVAIIEAVRLAQKEALHLDDNNRNIILVPHLPHRFLGRPDRENPERFTNVSLFVLPGYTTETKRQLYRAIVDKLEPLGIPKTCVLIKFHELSPENTAIRGGIAMCDLDYAKPTNKIRSQNSKA
ncbi:MAG: hypothetical protein A2622_04760 [Bdellovibrionales bacterium RIFCSPHIGHO2_01_FULL_40_29]|nr:MAG: hypothetical protein A2622_04760 [Bdellovibrionales bacterium RIFCSPHIGHO2_01_FULL_40_29]OFZ34755.1 MAG: hypothetical protein A3D17_10610 [Bdellovibrionales bacterium RIFCSPHIGHO2_02_FULL_40_15]